MLPKDVKYHDSHAGQQLARIFFETFIFFRDHIRYYFPQNHLPSFVNHHLSISLKTFSQKDFEKIRKKYFSVYHNNNIL